LSSRRRSAWPRGDHHRGQLARLLLLRLGQPVVGQHRQLVEMTRDRRGLEGDGARIARIERTRSSTGTRAMPVR
jgi:hypothetical protein